jgi:hypothetical protein
MKHLRYLANIEIALALAGWAVGLWGIVRGEKIILQYLFFFAWYPAIACLDGLLFRLRGQSWLLTQPRKFLRMFFWSVTTWLIFEAFNLALKNWGYVAMEPDLWVRWGGYALAFATVLPGVLLTAQVLDALGAWKNLKARPLNLGAWQPLSLLLGVAFLVLPLIFPRYAFPLVWGATFFLLDPFCWLLGEDSLIARFAAGQRREHLCLLAAGLICGLWWEAWNWFAVSKWVYTLPVLGFAKVFEMPVLGFLGFPPFALECAVMYNFLRALDERVLTTLRRRRVSYGVHLAFWLVMFAAIDAWTVISFQK